MKLALSYKLGLLKPLCPPYQYSIEATNYCNFKCVFCPQSSPEHRLSREFGYLTVENFRLFLERIQHERPGNRNISICLDGEPLLNKHFPEFIILANEAGMKPRFSSNGKLLTPQLADRLAECGRFLVAIDFASDADVFDTIRGRPGDFDIVLGHLTHLIDIAARNRQIDVEIMDTTHFDGRDQAASLEKMRGLFRSDLPANVVIGSRTFHNFGGHLAASSRSDKYKLCPYPWTSFSATWQGDVVACCRDTLAKTILGNVFNKSIREIWWGGEYLAMRKHLVERQPQKIAACAKCDLPWSGSTSRWKLRYIASSLLRR
ncbi:MAG: radical SAM protein [Planctomycetes bacterium]|nr:radical SAM protein [Planctomycetota bacterium]